jgi:hypothetical protein
MTPYNGWITDLPHLVNNPSPSNAHLDVCIRMYLKLLFIPSFNFWREYYKNIVEVFESSTTSFWTMDTHLFSGHLGAFDALSH